VAKQRRARPWLLRQSERIEKHVLARRLASENEVQAARPPKNAHTIEWCQYYGQLRAWVWGQDSAPGSRDIAEERLLSALREVPEEVVLSNGSTVSVYPKSIDALLWFRERDWLLAWLLSRIDALHLAMADDEVDRNDFPTPVTSLQQATRELSHQLACMASVACTKGPALPLNPNEPDVLFTDLEPHDLLKINSAFLEVNAGRMAALSLIVKPPKSNGDSDGRMSWNVFVGTLAMRLKTEPERLAKDRSLVSLLAQVRLGNSIYDEMEAVSDG